MSRIAVKGFNLASALFIALIILTDFEFRKVMVTADENGFYPGYVGALNSTIENLMTQLKVYQQYIDQAFQPLNQYDKIFKKPIESFSANAKTPEATQAANVENSGPVQAPDLTTSAKISPESAGPVFDQSPVSNDQIQINPSLPEKTSATPVEGKVVNVSSFDELLSTISTEVDQIEKDKIKQNPLTKDRQALPTNHPKETSNIEKYPQATEIHKDPDTLSFIDGNSQPNSHNIDDRVDLPKSPTPSLPTHCGIFNPNLFVGKSRRDHILWPWIASLGKQYKSGFLYKCGGALVNPRVIISSAHCLANGEIDSVDIGGNKISIEKTIIHPEYRENIGYNDIAIVVLVKPVNPNPNVTPVCLPQNPQRTLTILDNVNSFSWSSEWNYKNYDGVLSLKVKNIHTKILNSTICEEESRLDNQDFSFMFPKGLDSTLLCVKSSRGRLCQRNAGVSLFTRDRSGISYLIGTIVKGEDSCGEAQLPSIYTRISAFSDWIHAHISNISLN